MVEQRGGAAVTRQQVIDAAIDTILQRGYYQASSNEIARRAGVSWGVIQYHFKTREKLLLATLEDATAAFRDYLHDARISGDTLAARLGSFGAIMWEYYASDKFLAHLQIIVNLLHDPTTAQGTRDALERSISATTADMNRLLDEATAPIELDPDDRRMIFAGLRGVALNDLLLRAFYPGPGDAGPDGRRADRPRAVEDAGGHDRTIGAVAEALAARLDSRARRGS